MNRQELTSPNYYNSDNVSISNLMYLSTPQLDEELNRLFGVHTSDSENQRAIQKPVARRSLFNEKPLLTNSTKLHDNTNQLSDIMREFQTNGIDYEYCPQDEDEILNVYYKTNEKTPEHLASSIFNRNKSRKRPKPTKSSSKYCVFCKNNERSPDIYLTHTFRGINNIVICPFLRQYVCPICSASGDNAHTIKYCPKSGSSWSRTSSSNSESSV